MSGAVVIHPLTDDRWADLEDLFGPLRGATSGCWCMSLRMSRPAYEDLGREGRKAAFQALVEAGPPPGLLAYAGATAVGWCAVGPRRSFARFETARVSRPVAVADDTDAARAFAITCFFIRSSYRKGGLMGHLAAAAVGFAAQHGALWIEACPLDTDRPLIWGDGFVGLSSVFVALGFTEIARRSPRRPLMRLALDGNVTAPLLDSMGKALAGSKGGAS